MAVLEEKGVQLEGIPPAAAVSRGRRSSESAGVGSKAVAVAASSDLVNLSTLRKKGRKAFARTQVSDDEDDE